jgi:3D (Asp-Asp-Asp) domain-containing protein
MLQTGTSPHRTIRAARRRRTRAVVQGAVLALAATALLAPAASAKPMSKPGWVKGVLLTEYYPVPESWFVGRKVSAPGLSGTYHVDWLYSARGVAMEGDGIDEKGREVHIDELGSAGWIGENGKPGSYYWRSENYWKNSKGSLTFPLEAGGWDNGVGKKFVANKGSTFALGASRDLNYYRSIAVDPGLIPLGSRVYLRAYRKASANGWMCAADTGGAIKGRHIDVYRPAPSEAFGQGFSTPDQPAYVVPPGKSLPKGAPKMPTDPC